MRVLFLSGSSKVGGGARSLLGLATGLRRRGIDTLIVLPGAGALQALCDAEAQPYRVLPLPQPGWREPLASWRGYALVRELLREWPCDLVHANDLSTARAVSVAAWRSGLPVVCHVRFPAESSYVRWAFRGLPKPRAFVFNSRALLAETAPELLR
ncbi:MAG: glycosyltransferase, partial [Candidatus Binatia bacterium]